MFDLPGHAAHIETLPAKEKNIERKISI